MSFAFDKKKLVVAGLSLGLIGSGFFISRLTQPTDANAAANKAPVAVVSPPPVATPSPSAAEEQAFYQADYKVGYGQGFQQGRTGKPMEFTATTRTGFNEGFKIGYTEGVKASVRPQPVRRAVPVARAARQQYVAADPATTAAPAITPAITNAREPQKGSKAKAIMTVVAPAAAGAGIGALAGGKKGAGIGALIGGGVGAMIQMNKKK